MQIVDKHAKLHNKLVDLSSIQAKWYNFVTMLRAEFEIKNISKSAQPLLVSVKQYLHLPKWMPLLTKYYLQAFMLASCECHLWLFYGSGSRFYFGHVMAITSWVFLDLKISFNYPKLEITPASIATWSSDWSRLTRFWESVDYLY